MKIENYYFVGGWNFGGGKETFPVEWGMSKFLALT